MLRININSFSVLAVDNDVFEHNPINMFEMYYKQMGMMDQVPFAQWMLLYIIPNNYKSMEREDVIAFMERTLKDKDSLIRASLRLYPVQQILDEVGWEEIQLELEKVLQDRYTRPMDLDSYEDQLAFFEKNKNIVLGV